ncbi:RNase adapter RapZ [Lachnoclostridium sp. Marseille-P6806]|uniref:RNase adapter RapZ n=1 Tax=Lachnoclostridium sp. Marseille-P6806 TaxID=2364793 RepID=UPI001031348D|nr:RNase adapter RapZ [Lachnoclostridium sp. Marseille-P6806]
MQIVVVTGMSGGGKMTAIKMLEDQGFYCVDNLPVRLIDKFMDLMAAPGSEITRVCIGIDVRSDGSFDYVLDVLNALKEKGYDYQILFMDASDEVLIKRYKESRRAHPVAPNGRVEEGIAREREILRVIKEQADYVFDTSNLLTRELKAELIKIFQENKDYNSLIVSVMSFGFKYGIPADADLVFDVRFLPNPYYIDSMKHLTGDDAPVRDYVLSFPQTQEFLHKLIDMIRYLIPYYVKEGKNQLVIAVGCTGGQHRSVTLANELYRELKDHGAYGLNLFHRDEKKHS